MSRSPALFLLVACLLTGCASAPRSARPGYSPTLAPPPGQGLVVLYWKTGTTGSAERWEIFANQQRLTNMMRAGAFFTHFAEPGDLQLESAQAWNWNSVEGLNVSNRIDRDRPTVQIAAGQTYFFELYFGAWREKIRQVSRETAEAELKHCHWINPPPG